MMMDKRRRRTGITEGDEKLKWYEFRKGLYYAWWQHKIGYQISKHGEDEPETGYRLRIYRIEPGVPLLFIKTEYPDLQAAKEAAEEWRAQNREAGTP